MKFKKITLIILAFFILVLAGYLYNQYKDDQQIVTDEATIIDFFDCAENFAVMESYPRQCTTANGTHFVEDIGNELEKDDLITIESPRPNQIVTSPLEIKGQARGLWFFEGDFPVSLLDEDKNEIATAIASTPDAWMTEDFIEFSSTIEFEAGDLDRGLLILHRDNPSDMPENDDFLRVPVFFK